MYGDCKNTHTLLLYLSLKRKFLAAVRNRGRPFPPAYRILPGVVCWWNLNKGGVDVFSRTLKNVKAPFKSLNPYAALWIRMLLSQAYNAHIIARLYLIKDKLSSLKSVDQVKNYLNRQNSFQDNLGVLAISLKL